MLNIYIDRSSVQLINKLLPVFLILLIFTLFTSNSMLSFIGILIIPLLIILLWRDDEPPALFFAASYQFIQVYSPLIAANIAGVSIIQYYSLDTMIQATLLSFLAIIILSLGMRIGLIGARLNKKIKLDYKALQKPALKNVIIFYFLVLIFKATMDFIGSLLPSISSITHVIGFIWHSVIFFIFILYIHNEKFKYFGLFVLFFEILNGFLGFFGSFKIILFLFFIAYLTKIMRSKKIFNFGILFIVFLTFTLGTLWQSIKNPYRAILNQGELTQEVNISTKETIYNLQSIISDLDSDQILLGLSSIPSRLGYVEYFGHCIDMIPETINHENGKLLKESFLHVLQPRVFFPEKQIISDSVRTNKYTGVRVAGVDEGASIGLGYIAESYVDFGPILMFVPIFFIGLFWSIVYRLIISSALGAPIIGIMFATVCVVFGGMLVEKSNIKIIGGTLSFLIVWLPLLTLFSKKIWYLLCQKINI